MSEFGNIVERILDFKLNCAGCLADKTYGSPLNDTFLISLVGGEFIRIDQMYEFMKRY